MRPSAAFLLLASLLTLPAPPALPASTGCTPSGHAATLEELVARIEAQDLRYVFIGERHGVGPVKRFAVELTGALSDRGYDVGLYVEGFRAGCAPREPSCWSLARAFRGRAFATLLEESRVPVHGIDHPPGSEGRAARMAGTIAGGSERVRVILVGKSHVIYAGESDAELWVYGGGLRFENPGDLAEAFPSDQSLTIGWESSEGSEMAGGDDSGEDAGAFALLHDGCGLDYRVATGSGAEYWGPVPGARGSEESGDR